MTFQRTDYFAPGEPVPGQPPAAPPPPGGYVPGAAGTPRGTYNHGGGGGIKNVRAGFTWGQGLEAQGRRNEKDMGKAAFSRLQQENEFGYFNNPTWQRIVKNGKVYMKPLPNQAGRIAEGGWTLGPGGGVQGDWQLAPDYVQKSYQKQQAWNAANPGKTFEDRAIQDALRKHLGSGAFQIDPNTGLAVNQGGEVWDPSTGRKMEDTRYITGQLVNPWNAAYAGPKAGGTGAPLAGRAAMQAGLLPGPGGGVSGAPGASLVGGNMGGSLGVEGGLEKGLQDLLANQGPFTPEVIQNLRNQAKTDAYGGLKQTEAAANEDAVSRGIYRSGIPGDVQRQAVEQANQRYSTATQNIGTTAALQNYQARLNALDRAQKWLDSKRQWILSNETNAINKDLGLKQIGLGYARIEAEKQSLDKQLGQQNYQFNQLNPNLNFTDPVTGQVISLPPGALNYLNYFTG